MIQQLIQYPVLILNPLLTVKPLPTEKFIYVVREFRAVPGPTFFPSNEGHPKVLDENRTGIIDGFECRAAYE
jgi:hypothetical protein